MSRFSQHYLIGLKRYLARDAGPSLDGAAYLGEEASELGLATLAIARIHDHSLVALALSVGNEATSARSEAFFLQAIRPTVEAQRSHSDARGPRESLKADLEKRTAELAIAIQELQLGVQKQKKLEATLKGNADCHAKMLKESLRLQDHFQRLTHQVLATQEVERKKISRELNEEVAQTLLGINIRLASLRQAARGSAHGLKAEIANTQRLAIRSARSVSLVARRLGKI